MRSILGFTCVCPIPLSSYSIGSSMVRMFLSGSLISDSAEYRVVVFPEPVGPQTRIIPKDYDVKPSLVSTSDVSI